MSRQLRVHAPFNSWICAQIGAREHYAIPRVLHRSGRLEMLFTDFWINGWRALLARTLGARRLAGRFHGDLTEAEVVGLHATSLRSAIETRSVSNPYIRFLRAGSRFGKAVRARLRRRTGQNWSRTIFFGYDTGFLEAAAWVKDQGGKSIVCQMDPARTEVELVQAEQKRWAGWAKAETPVPEDYFAWRKTEWALADLVLVNSDWSREALLQQGVPEAKLRVLPLAYETTPSPAPGVPSPGNRQLRVLFLGQANLRKGIPYLLEAAKGLSGVQIDIVGPVGIAPEKVVTAPANVRFHGSVSRDRTAAFYREADVFVLPTLSDGFALTQLEAMAHGLPVVATPHCGRVVTDGLDGFVIPAGDSAGLRQALECLRDDPERVEAMGMAALEKVQSFSMDNLEQGLLALERDLLGKRSSAR